MNSLTISALTIRKLDPEIKGRLRVAAAMNGRSMEEEARMILSQALQPPAQASGLGSKIHQRFMEMVGADDAAGLPLPARQNMARGADFEA